MLNYQRVYLTKCLGLFLTSQTYFLPSHLACSDLHRSASQSDPVRVRRPETSCLHSYCHQAKPDQVEILREIPQVMVASSSLIQSYLLGWPARSPRILHWSCEAGVSLGYRCAGGLTLYGDQSKTNKYNINPAFRTTWCIMFVNGCVLGMISHKRIS